MGTFEKIISVILLFAAVACKETDKQELNLQLIRLSRGEDRFYLNFTKEGALIRNTELSKKALAEARKLIQAGAQVNTRDQYGWTPLMYAAKSGQVELAQGLLAAGADVNAATRLGDTALIHAATGAVPEMIGVLVKAGAKVDAKGDNGNTALILAGAHGITINSQLLLKAGGDVNVQNNQGQTALIKNVLIGGYDVSLLLENGADPKIKDYEGKTALDYAIELRQLETVQILEGEGVD